jgi:RNA polymerase sigma factor (sigma-70 family)
VHAIPFQRLLDDHADDVLRYLVATLGRPDADDAFQETFLAAMRAWPRLRPGSNLRAWVLTIAHRKALDVFRARGRNPVPVEDLGDRPAADEPVRDDWEAVRHLPPRQRAVLTLRFAGDLTHAEIAAVLDTTEAASRRAAADGLKALRKEYAA